MKNKFLIFIIVVMLFVVVGFTYSSNVGVTNKQLIKPNEFKKTDNIINSDLLHMLITEKQANYKFTGYTAGYLLWIIPSEINAEPLVEMVRIEN